MRHASSPRSRLAEPKSGEKKASPLPILAKIAIPRTNDLIPRKRVFRLLEKAMCRTAIWIVSPAGSGKTSLASSFLKTRNARSLWYRADAGDGDIATFFYFLGQAAKYAAPRYRQPMPLLTQEYCMGATMFARRFFEALYKRLTPPFSIVLDDYHEIPADSPLHEIIDIGIATAPEGINIFVLSRNSIPAACTRSLANNRISRIGWEELCFTEQEAKMLVRASVRAKLPPKALSLIHQKTAGWVAGLVLLIGGLRQTNLDLDQLENLSPGEIHEYFAREIFNKADREEKTLLVATALLPSVSTHTAEFLTGNPSAGQILLRLNERGCFTEKQPALTPTYLYHPLFREFLLSRLNGTFTPAELIVVQEKAAALLVDQGKTDTAAALLINAGRWTELAKLILAQAPVLVAQGRSGVLAGWLNALPNPLLQTTPWLLYWRGVSQMAFDPAGSRKLFEKAHQLFKDNHDDPGALVSWAGAVDACFFEFDDFRPLDDLIDWLDERTRRSPLYPSPEIEANIAVSMSNALLWRRPDHSDIGSWMRRASALSQNSANPVLHVNASIGVATYYNWIGETLEYHIVLDPIKKVADSAAAPPLIKIAAKFLDAHCSMQRPGECDRALRSASEGLAIAEETGVHLLDSMIIAQAALGALIEGNTRLTEEFLTKMEATMAPGRRGAQGIFYNIQALHNLTTGNIPNATGYAEKSVTITKEAGVAFPEAMSRILSAQAEFEAGDHKKAALQLAQAEQMLARFGSRYFEYTCNLVNAFFALRLGRESDALAVLRKAFSLAKKKGYAHAPYFWRKDAMSRLCIKALQAGIEVEYVQTIIRKLDLVPEIPPVEIETWPWPVKIYSLGRFEVLTNGQPVEFFVKAPRRIIALLKLLIACGENGASEERLADLLWPDAEGDTALQSVATSLHRLRQMLGYDKAVQRRDGRVKLDARYCWVDAHAFELLLERADGGSGTSPPFSTEPQIRLIENAVSLYKGGFLSEALEPWAISYRERLRERYLNAMARLGRRHEMTGATDRAIECYQAALACDNLAEQFYCRIIRCYSALGRRAEAIAVYTKCRRVLEAELGVGPSAETEALRQELYKR